MTAAPAAGIIRDPVDGKERVIRAEDFDVGPRLSSGAIAATIPLPAPAEGHVPGSVDRNECVTSTGNVDIGPHPPGGSIIHNMIAAAIAPIIRFPSAHGPVLGPVEEAMPL